MAEGLKKWQTVENRVNQPVPLIWVLNTANFLNQQTKNSGSGIICAIVYEE